MISVLSEAMVSSSCTAVVFLGGASPVLRREACCFWLSTLSFIATNASLHAPPQYTPACQCEEGGRRCREATTTATATTTGDGYGVAAARMLNGAGRGGACGLT